MILLAEASPDSVTMAIIQTLLQAGVAGVVLLWFMVRGERRMIAVESSMNDMTRSVLLLVICMDEAKDSVKNEARTILRGVERREIERKLPRHVIHAKPPDDSVSSEAPI